MGEQRLLESPEANEVVLEHGERVTGKTIYRLIRKQGFRCALTGQQLTPETASVDHKQPLTKGGKHTIENAQIVEAEVNRMKGSLTNEEFIAICCRVAAWAGQRDV